MLLFQSMSIINDKLGQAFMLKREYESLQEEEKAWGKLQRLGKVSFMAVIWLAVIVSTVINLKIMFPSKDGKRLLCVDRRVQSIQIELKRDSDSDMYLGAFYLTDLEITDYYWMVVFILSFVIFMISCVYLVAGNVSAARNVGVWKGTCYLTPLIGVVLAYGSWGRYWKIFVFSMIYFIGMCILTISASVPSLKPAECLSLVCPPASPLLYYLFYFGLDVIALGTGGIKSCVSPFGADQFDQTDSEESVKKASFFNWYYFSIMLGAIVSCNFVVWVQDNLGWGLGFGIPALFMGLFVGSFFFGTSLDRFQKPKGSPLTCMCQLVLASVRKRNLVVSEDSSLLYERPVKRSGVAGSRKLMHHDDM